MQRRECEVGARIDARRREGMLVVGKEVRIQGCIGPLDGDERVAEAILDRRRRS